MTSAIRGGEGDSGDPAVVALSVGGLDAYCSASLIAPHTILTAGHCVVATMQVNVGSNAVSPTQTIDVTKAVTHPMYTGEGKPYDFALMQLASDPTGVAPLALSASALGNGDVGRTIRHVGFGVTDDCTDVGGGIKRTVSYPITKVTGTFVYSGAQGEQTCDGDSGGPGFLTSASGVEAIAGVVSDGPECQLSEPGWDDRVDVVMDWIVSTVSSSDAPPTFVDTGSDHTSTGCSAGLDARGMLIVLVPFGLLRRRATRRVVSSHVRHRHDHQQATHR